MELWKIAISVVLDHEEASVIRENAALLLANLTVHLINSSNKAIRISSSMSSDTLKVRSFKYRV